MVTWKFVDTITNIITWLQLRQYSILADKHYIFNFSSWLESAQLEGGVYLMFKSGEGMSETKVMTIEKPLQA